MKSMFADIYTDAAGLARTAKTLTDSEGVLKESKEGVAIDVLALSRDALRRLSEARAEAVKPFKQSMAPIESEAKKVQAVLASIELGAKDAIVGAIQDGRDIQGMTKNETQLTVSRRRKAVVVDASKVPDEFLLPREKCIDMAKLEEAMKQRDKVIQASFEAGVDTEVRAIPGAELVDTYVLTTRLGEEFV